MRRWCACRFELRRLAVAAVMLAVQCLGAQVEPRAEAAAVPFLLRNPSDTPRTEVIRVSLPLARGACAAALSVRVGDELAPAVPLVHWGDGSIAVLQAHYRAALGPREVRRAAATPRAEPVPAAAAAWHWPDELPLHAEVEDPWGQVFSARLQPDATLVATSSSLVRTRCYRGLSVRGNAAFFGVLAYLTTFCGERRAELTLVLDNRANPRLPGPVLGPARFRRFALITESAQVRLRPRFAAENALHEPIALPDGCYQQDLLGPSDQLYLGDHTSKAFRFDLYLDDGDRAARAAALLAVDAPIEAWPELDAVRRSRAFGAHGGPAPAGLDESRQRAAAIRAAARFGPFAAHGDAEDAAANGTPRNGPSALHDVLRWQSRDLLAAAEAMVLQQALRPTPAGEPRLPEATAALRRGMSPRSIARPHGFTALDYEHVSVDLLYDWYWLTGDAFARDEIARVGSGLLALLQRAAFVTCRGEGWSLQAAVLIARASGDRALLDAVLRRFRAQVVPTLQQSPPHIALPQPGHVDAFGLNEPFDAPWQMAALVHGLHAAWHDTGDADLAAAAVRVAQTMAGPGWIEGVGPKSLVSAREPVRSALPIGFAPLQGTATMQVGAFVLAAEMTSDRDLAERLVRRAGTIAAAEPDVLDAAARSRWLQLYWDRQANGR